MSRFADPHPAMLFFSLPLGSTCPRPIEMPCPCCKSAFHVRSVVTKLITATHSSALLHDLQSLFRFLAARTMWPACSLNPQCGTAPTVRLAVSSLAGFRTPAPVPVARSVWGRHPKTFTNENPSLLALCQLPPAADKRSHGLM